MNQTNQKGKAMKATLLLIIIISLLTSRELIAWEREVSLGYNATSGNTETGSLSLRASLHKKQETDEITFKGDYYVSTSEGEMNAQKWYGLGRYAYSFSEGWYNFYKAEVDHDKFANIDVRLMPSVGVSYWFSDKPDLKFMLEIGGGVEYTIRDTTKDKAIVATPRLFFERKLFGKAKISQDISIYPQIGDLSKYRWRAETNIINPLSDKFSLKLSFIHDYNSDPGGAEKADSRFISSIIYKF